MLTRYISDGVDEDPNGDLVLFSDAERLRVSATQHRTANKRLRAWVRETTKENQRIGRLRGKALVEIERLRADLEEIRDIPGRAYNPVAGAMAAIAEEALKGGA